MQWFSVYDIVFRGNETFYNNDWTTLQTVEIPLTVDHVLESIANDGGPCLTALESRGRYFETARKMIAYFCQAFCRRYYNISICYLNFPLSNSKYLYTISLFWDRPYSRLRITALSKSCSPIAWRHFIIDGCILLVVYTAHDHCLNYDNTKYHTSLSNLSLLLSCPGICN